MQTRNVVEEWICRFSTKAYRWFFGFGAPALNVLICLVLNIKYWSSPDLNSMRWFGLFTNKTFRKHLKLIFSHWDFIICIVSLEISVSSPFCHPHFSIRILSSAFFYPPSVAIRSALYRDPFTLRWNCCEDSRKCRRRFKPFVGLFVDLLDWRGQLATEF